MKNKALLLLAIGIIFFSGCTNTPTQTTTTTTLSAAEQPMVRTIQHQGLGGILVDRDGMTLYVTSGDEPYKSNCYGVCETTWLPFFISGDVTVSQDLEGKIETIARDTGTKQLAFIGMPLYYYSGDKGPGDINGQGIGGIWTAASTSSEGLGPGQTGETTSTVEVTTTQAVTTTAIFATTLPLLSGVIHVEINGTSFNPAEVRIRRGSTVEWKNDEDIPHTVTSDVGDELDSDTLMRDRTYSHTFMQVGTYPYHCGFNTGIRGKVTVE